MGPCQPLGRVGEDIEIAKLAAFLASKDNAFMTGSEILADGGASLTSSIAAKSAEIYTAMQQAAAKGGKWGKYLKNKTCFINDPLGQTHSPTSSYHYFHTTVVLYFEIFWLTDGRKHVKHV